MPENSTRETHGVLPEPVKQAGAVLDGAEQSCPRGITRRNLLRLGGLIAAAAVLTACAPKVDPTPEPTAKPVGVGQVLKEARARETRTAEAIAEAETRARDAKLKAIEKKYRTSMTLLYQRFEEQGVVVQNWSEGTPLCDWGGTDFFYWESTKHGWEGALMGLNISVPAESKVKIPDGGVWKQEGFSTLGHLRLVGGFTGEIPSELGDLPALWDLSIDCPGITGEIKGKYPNLQTLELCHSGVEEIKSDVMRTIRYLKFGDAPLGKGMSKKDADALFESYPQLLEVSCDDPNNPGGPAIVFRSPNFGR